MSVLWGALHPTSPMDSPCYYWGWKDYGRKTAIQVNCAKSFTQNQHYTNFRQVRFGVICAVKKEWNGISPFRVLWKRDRVYWGHIELLLLFCDIACAALPGCPSPRSSSWPPSERTQAKPNRRSRKANWDGWFHLHLSSGFFSSLSSLLCFPPLLSRWDKSDWFEK